MTDDELRHMNVLLEGIKQEVRLVREGHQVLDHKIDEARLELKAEIANTRVEIKTEIGGLRHEMQSLRGCG